MPETPSSNTPSSQSEGSQTRSSNNWTPGSATRSGATPTPHSVSPIPEPANDDEPASGATLPPYDTEPLDDLTRDAVHDVRKVFKEHGEDFGKGEEEAIMKNEPVEKVSFPFLIFLLAACKDHIDFTLIELTGVGYVLVLLLSWGVWLILFFWFFGKISGTSWKGRLLKRFWKTKMFKRLIVFLCLESIPIVKMVPANMIFVLMAHYRETKIVKLLNVALEVWNSYEEITHIMKPGGGEPPGGATPMQKVKMLYHFGEIAHTTHEAKKDLFEKNPVLAMQEEHFANSSQPIAQGATQPSTSSVRRIPRRQQRNPQDEEVVTNNGSSSTDDKSFSDTYRENPYSTDASARKNPSNKQQKDRNLQENAPAPFPGTSPQFGREGRYQAREALAGNQEGKVLNFDLRHKASELKSREDTPPGGATPMPKAA